MKLYLFLFIYLFCSAALYAGGQITYLSSTNQKVLRSWKAPAHVKWRYQKAGAPVEAKNTIEEAFKVWTDAAEGQISAEYSGETNLNFPTRDGYSDIFFNVNFSALGSSNIFALTFLNSEDSDTPIDGSRYITEADILINPKFQNTWISGEPTSALDNDLKEILIHEIGHLLGLSHSLLIDSNMYPGKPTPTFSDDYISLFRTSKRILSQDDISTLNSIYPWSGINQAKARIQGEVKYNDAPFVGANIVALKLNESDLALSFFSFAGKQSLVAKGLQNISAYSDETGNFEIQSMPPGKYKLLTYSADGFLGTKYINISNFLDVYGSLQNLTAQFLSSPDCSNIEKLNSSNFSDLYTNAATIDIGEGQSACDVQIMARSAANNCGRTIEIKNSCQTGGCSISDLNLKDHPGIGLILVGFIIVIFAGRRGKKKFKDEMKRREKLKKNTNF